MDQPDPSQMRVSDQDRHTVAEVLRDAAAEGRLDLDELEERLQAAYSAKVYADLVPLTVDLPVSDQLPVQARPAPLVPGSDLSATYESSIAVMASVERKGEWTLGSEHTAFSLMGGVRLDLRRATFTVPETVITANTVMGGIDIWVNAYTQVIVEGVGVMGDFSQGKDKVPAEITASSPLVRVKGFALMGGVTVTRKQMPGEPGPLRRMLHGG